MLAKSLVCEWRVPEARKFPVATFVLGRYHRLFRKWIDLAAARTLMRLQNRTSARIRAVAGTVERHPKLSRIARLLERLSR